MRSRYALTTTARKLAGCERFYRIMQGGMSSGKTIAALMVILSYAMKYRNKLVTVATDTAPNLREGALRDWKSLLDDTNLIYRFEVKLTTNEYVYRATNTTVEFIALDDPFKARGARRDVLYVNEANRLRQDTFDQLSSRTRDFVVIDFNPSSRFWAHDLVEQYPDDCDFFITTYKDNEALSESERLNIERHDHKSNWWRVYGLGQIGELENNVYKGWQKIDVLPTDAQLIAYGLDYGSSPDPTALIAMYRTKESIVFAECMEQSNLLNSQICDLISHEIDMRGDKPIYCDYGGGGASLINELTQHGIMAVNADKSSGSVLEGINEIQNIPHVQYMGKNLEREYLAYQHRVKKGSGEILPTPQDGNDHLMDALRYAYHSWHHDDMIRQASLARARLYTDTERETEWTS